MALERLGRFYLYSIFKSSSIIIRWLVNMHRLAPTIGPPKQNDFLVFSDFDYISIMHGDHSPKWNYIGGTFSRLTVHAFWGQMFMRIVRVLARISTDQPSNNNFFPRLMNVRKWLIGRTDLITVWYSVTNNGVSSNNQFRFQGNAGEVNRTSESMWNSVANIFIHRVSINDLYHFINTVELGYNVIKGT
jgi:hypothetical protein